MAKATVTLKVTPHELQIIRDALRLYSAKMRNIERGDNALNIQLDIYGADPRRCSALANSIITDIGMK